MQSIINKLPEVIKCIIYDYSNNILNYLIELQSDKFIGNPIDLFDKCGPVNYYYHLNKLNGFKTPLHFIGLDCYKQVPQEILNKLQYFALLHYDFIPYLQNVKTLYLCFCNFTEIPNIKGLLKLECYKCNKLTRIPNIIGLKKLFCSWCYELTEIPHIKGLQILDCSYCALNTIPHIIGLKKLRCYYINLLTEIPHIIGLLELDCSGCGSLAKIPYIDGLLKYEGPLLCLMNRKGPFHFKSP